MPADSRKQTWKKDKVREFKWHLCVKKVIPDHRYGRVGDKFSKKICMPRVFLKKNIYLSSCLRPKYLLVMATDLWWNSSISLTRASSEFSLFILYTCLLKVSWSVSLSATHRKQVAHWAHEVAKQDASVHKMSDLRTDGSGNTANSTDIYTVGT